MTHTQASLADRPGQRDRFDLSGGAAIVTGGGSGIGRAIAVGLAQHGARVGIFDLPGEAPAETLALVEAAGGEGIVVAGSVTDRSALDSAVAAIEERFGSLTLAVNSAGISSAGPAETMPLEQWQSVVDVDQTGVFLSCQAEAAAMLRAGSGSIVNVASMSGSRAHRGLDQAHYYSAKAAVKHLSSALAVEWAPHNIRVNSLSPGYTLTAMNTRPEVADHVAELAAQTPMNRFAEPDEMVGPAVFLLSRAASYCTGIDLLVDGGYCAW